jgi:putative toxin-antitoxin system antitoxin component (TIGR02293 family)
MALDHFIMSTRNEFSRLPDVPAHGGFGEAPFQESAVGQGLSAKWDEAQAASLSGTPVQLHPRELGFWSSRFSADEIDVLVIPKRTLARRKANREKLTIEETDKAFRLARIVTEADRVFGDPEKSSRWLRKRNAALGGHSPLDLLKSETGARAVDDLLGQIDHGMFS